MYTFVSILVCGRIQVAKPTLRTNHILHYPLIYIYTFELYIRIRLSLYLYMAYLGGETHS